VLHQDVTLFRKQIIAVIKYVEGGNPVSELCREYGISPAKIKRSRTDVRTSAREVRFLE
jgi:transposase-like protein